MLLRDLQILNGWQTQPERCAEREFDKLNDCLCALTDLAKQRDGAIEISKRHEKIKAALVRLHDLYIETTPVKGVAA